MRKIIGFIIIVILIILIIVLSNKYYGKSSNNKSLSTSNTTSTKITTNTNTSDDTTDNNSTVVEEKNTINNNNDDVDNVPDTASDDNNGYVAVESFTVNIDKTVLKVGDSEKINVIINPNNASEKEVNFTSSNKDVLTVSSVGIIKAKHKGTALVTVSVKNHNDYKIIINVK